MVQFQTMNRTEQVLLLGFLPLLGATGEIGTAIAAAVIGIVAALVVWATSRLVPERHGEIAHWSVLLVVGFSLSYVLGAVAGYVVPVPPRSVLYLYLIGAAPLVYIGAGRIPDEEHPVQYRLLILARYAILMIAIGVIRELLGRGTLLGTPTFAHGMVPVGILSTEAGSLFLFAGVAFLSHTLNNAIRRKEEALQ